MTNSSCPNVLSNGICEDKTCTFIHNILTCDLCGLVLRSAEDYNQHLKSRQHRLRILGQTIVSYCSICEVNVATYKDWEQHIQGRNHRRKADGAGVPIEVAPQPAVSTAFATACDLCQVVVPNHDWNQHISSSNHQLHEQFSRYTIAVEESETDKNGVVVEGSFDFDIIDPSVAAVGKELTATIKALQASSKCVLLEAKLASAQGKSSGVSL